MKIYLSGSTAARGAGGLKKGLRHLDRYIQNELTNVGFKSSFEELWLTLAYPQMYMLPGVLGMENNYKRAYEKFPYSRVDRRFRKIDITLQSPEFSEHFDLDEQNQYQDKFHIELQYQNINEVELGKILIDKFLEAGEIIKSKLKKEDIFTFDIFNNVLNSIKANINSDFLRTVHTTQKDEIKKETIKRALDLREKRKTQNTTKDKLIRDLRVYCFDMPLKALYPYDYQYTEIFLNLLAREQFMCPTYHHLYIRVAKSIDEALMQSFSIEDWYVYGLSVIDFENYKLLSEKDKELIVFHAILNGLKDIANIDNLDIEKIEKVARKIQERGLDTELKLKTIENSHYLLTIKYLARSMEEECPVYFDLTDKTNEKSTRIQIGKVDKSQIHLWLQKVTLANGQIKLISSDSIRGQVLLKDKPTSMEFDISEIMKK